jgi:phosphatidylglycerol:prolipoprotein diacylglycerol transferase
VIGAYLFKIGSFGVPAMGVCVLVGAILAVLLSWLLRKKSALDWNDAVVDAIIWAVLLGFAGMKILYWIVTPDVFKNAFADGFFKGVLSLLMEGMVFYGGLIGGILGILIVSRKKKQNFFEFTDLMAPCFCVAHAFGRIGCLLVGCCYGLKVGEMTQFGITTYDGRCAVKYADGAMRLPVPLMETIFLLALCVLLVLIYRKEKRLGTTTGWYLVLYALWRFGVEMLRGDAERGKFGPLYTSQWISIVILAAGVAILVLSRRFKWKKGEPFRVFREDDMTVPTPEEAAEEAIEEAAEAVKATEEAVEETAETAGEAADAIAENAEEAAEQAKETVEEAAEQAEEIAEEAAGQAEVTGEEAVGQAEETAEEAAEQTAEDADDAIANWVRETLGDKE